MEMFPRFSWGFSGRLLVGFAIFDGGGARWLVLWLILFLFWLVRFFLLDLSITARSDSWLMLLGRRCV